MAKSVYKMGMAVCGLKSTMFNLKLGLGEHKLTARHPNSMGFPRASQQGILGVCKSISQTKASPWQSD